jgi:hypothetical protein
MTYYNHTRKPPKNQQALEPNYISTPEELRSQADRLELQAQQARALANMLDCEADQAISLVQYLRLEATLIEGGSQ